jgi:hypothetical protein
MAATFAFGVWFIARVPDVHLQGFLQELAHGEIVLMVDVPRARAAEIEQRVERRHPQVQSGGSGWTMDAFGV